MVLGAGWAGARSMTSTSGPGISLMSEFSGLGYYAEIARRHLRRAAHRSFDRHAHAHPAVRLAVDGLPVAWRHQAHRAVCRVREGMLRIWLRGFRHRGAVSDAGVRAQRSRPGHEQLDVRAVRLSRQAARSRQGAYGGRSQSPGRIRALSRCGRRCDSVGARCPARRIPKPPTSRAAPATTTRPATPRNRTNTRPSWSGCCASSRTRASGAGADRC